MGKTMGHLKLYPSVIRPMVNALSLFDGERAHQEALFFLRLCGLPPIRQMLSACTFIRNERTVFGVKFPNPVGAAAGFDKRGVALYGLEGFGFGFAEVGTVTPLPQPGNPKPRLFRLTEDEAIINRMGFNNDGAVALADRMSHYRGFGIPIGINIGKNKDTPIEQAADDYEKCITALYQYADYFTINVSSPNTKDLRQLQEKSRLEGLLGRVQQRMRESSKGQRPKPVLLKIAPDVSPEELHDILEVSESRVQGLIIHNTTVARPDTLRSSHREEAGGLSGKPLQKRAVELVDTVHRALPNMPIVGVGGIFGPEDALRLFDAGASLVQLYTGLVFEGPLLAYRINRALIKT